MSPATLKGYRIDLEQFCQAVSKTPDPFCRHSLNQYCRQLNAHYMPRTAKRKIASLKAFSRWLEFEDYFEADPFRKVNTKTKRIKEIPRSLSLRSMQTILQYAYSKAKHGNKSQSFYRTTKRNIAILELLFATGLRVSELCSLKAEDIRYSPFSICVMGKGNKERSIPVENQEVITALQKYMQISSGLRETRGYIFYNQNGNVISEQSVRNMVTKYAKEAGVSGKVTPHMIRHTFATLLLEQDVDIRYIQKMLGHSSILTTEIYTTVSDIKERQVVALRHPRNRFSINTG